MLELTPPKADDGTWKVNYAWQAKGTSGADQPVDTTDLKNGKVEIPIAFDSETTPGVKGKLRFVASTWNAD